VWSRSGFERFSLFREIVSRFFEKSRLEPLSQRPALGARALEAPLLPPGASRSLMNLSRIFFVPMSASTFNLSELFLGLFELLFKNSAHLRVM